MISSNKSAKRIFHVPKKGERERKREREKEGTVDVRATVDGVTMDQRFQTPTGFVHRLFVHPLLRSRGFSESHEVSSRL